MEQNRRQILSPVLPVPSRGVLFLFGVSLLGAGTGPANKMPLFLVVVSLMGAAAGPANKNAVVFGLLGAGTGPTNKMPLFVFGISLLGAAAGIESVAQASSRRRRRLGVVSLLGVGAPGG